ncbi:hypothetical protein IMSHALPRED_004244 [Imshaugia aleurites]|uniref:Uncharacterized protein n=1 Tax=Imshaugia aleurites TaxID=172621 RepID=A0A8H3F5V7_9LECA|nr:hypothetical protein IMSHALPRED_004244 [Imshaugia aleurites]
MHAKYGHVVRISPDELHVSDPCFLPKLMPARGRRRNKYPRLIQIFGFSQSAAPQLIMIDIIMTVHILSNPSILVKLRTELKTARLDVSAPMSMKIPNSCHTSAQSSRRVSASQLATASARHALAPTTSWFLTTEENVANPSRAQPVLQTPVGMAAPLVHLSPDVFVDPMKFRPERIHQESAAQAKPDDVLAGL